MGLTFKNFLPFVFFRWFEMEPVGHYIREATWIFAIIETLHIMALAVFLGTIFVVDLRLLGFGMKRQTPAEVARELAPWTLTSLAFMLLTGLALFSSEAIRMSTSSPFFYKIVFFTLGVIIHFTLYRKATQPNGNVGPGFAKLAGCLSLICWFGVALAGRAIAFL